MIKVGLLGATGRVGRLLIDILSSDVDSKLNCVYIRCDCNFHIPNNVVVTNDIKVLLQSSDLIIDFSSKEATRDLLKYAIKYPKPLVIGTTGLDSIDYSLLNKASIKMPILYSSNMSRGVFVLDKLASIVSKTLLDSDIEIVEIHHRKKKDAPSGTALKLAETCAKSRNLSLDSIRVSNRDGIIGERKDDEIGVMSLRGGDIVGKHTIGFYLDGEYIELIHNATDRKTFANGAIIASKWLYKQNNGLYSINDMLGVL